MTLATPDMARAVRFYNGLGFRRPAARVLWWVGERTLEDRTAI